MALFTRAEQRDYASGNMPAAERKTGPWGAAIEYWLKERRLRQADLVKGTRIEAKTISRITRGFHTQTRKLELIAKYLMVPLERVLVSPLRSGPSEDRRQLVRDIIDDALRSVDVEGIPIDETTLEMAKRFHRLPDAMRDHVLEIISEYEQAVANKRRRDGGGGRKAKKSSTAP
jgi:transcriptional regulator with XRE-family HTH domain